VRQVLFVSLEHRKPRSIRFGFHAAPAIRFGDGRVVPLIN
jgi:hypothetical protein